MLPDLRGPEMKDSDPAHTRDLTKTKKFANFTLTHPVEAMRRSDAEERAYPIISVDILKGAEDFALAQTRDQ